MLYVGTVIIYSYLQAIGIISSHDKNCFKTTDCDRTGCIFCGFGCYLESSPNRFQRRSLDILLKHEEYERVIEVAQVYEDYYPLDNPKSFLHALFGTRPAQRSERWLNT